MSTDQGQLFFENNGQSIHMLDVPIDLCQHSRFNTRKTRSEQDIQKLSDRMRANGFERTRALWAVQVDGHYEVFAGGTRLEAAKLAAVDTVPLMLHSGYPDEEISRRADVDNENDSYHTHVSIVDVWAEYARLIAEEGWDNQKIALVKTPNNDEPLVSRRLKFHRLPKKIKEAVVTGLLTEGHLTNISSIVVTLQLSAWLSTEQTWQELTDKIIHDISKNGSKTVSATRDDVAVWKAFIKEAEETYDHLSERLAYYDIEELDEDGQPKPDDYLQRQAFVRELRESQARTLTAVKSCARNVRQEYKNLIDAYQKWVELQSAEAAKQSMKDEAERVLFSKFICGNGIEALKTWTGEPIRLLLVDPPYGKDYQTNRRWRTNAPDKIVGDGPEEAMSLVEALLAAAVPHLAKDSHVVIFCAAEFEPDVRQMVINAGLIWKSHGIWLKEEHSAGDVENALAPDHECFVHAITGKPGLSPRRAETFKVTRSHETSHPNEKPLALLGQLIECMSHEGDLVVDPCAGCASTLVAALNLKREFWGAEIEQKYHDEGTTRLLKAWEAQCAR